MLADLLPLAEAWEPTLVVHDAADFAGPIAAAVIGVPSVTHAFGVLLPRARVAAAGDDVAPLWTEHGLEPRPYGGSYDHLYLDIYPPTLQIGVATTSPRSSRSALERSPPRGDETLPDWVTAQSTPPLVYVTFGTVFSNDAILSTIIEAVRELPVRIVATVGPRAIPRRSDRSRATSTSLATFPRASSSTTPRRSSPMADRGRSWRRSAPGSRSCASPRRPTSSSMPPPASSPGAASHCSPRPSRPRRFTLRSSGC